MRVRVVAAALVLVVSAAVAAAGCGGGSSPSGARRTRLTVLAAASLTDALGPVVQAFEAGHPGVRVTTSFAASSSLAAQVVAGGPGDVVITADERTMATLVAARRVRPPRVIARNRLAIMVERGNPKAIRGVRDLARPGLVVVLCAPDVPCGRYARLALAKAGVDVRPRSLEENVRGVVAKVTLGEADAGIVYATDVRSAGGAAEGVPVEGADAPDLLASYPAAAVVDSGAPDAARRFVDFLEGERARRLLAAAGFLLPGVRSTP